MLQNSRKIIGLLRAYVRYFRGLIMHFTWNAKAFWLPVIAFAIPVLAVPALNYSERSVRLSGLALQIMGFAITAAGLRGKRNAFDYPDWLARAKKHWEDRPRPPRTVSLQVSGILMPTFKMSARGTVGVGENATIDDRVKMLEENFKGLFTEVGKLSNDHQESEKRLERMVHDETEARKIETNSLEKRMSRALVDSLSLEWVGVGLFVFGVMLSTASPEISDTLLRILSPSF